MFGKRRVACYVAFLCKGTSETATQVSLQGSLFRDAYSWQFSFFVLGPHASGENRRAFFDREVASRFKED